MPFLSVFAMSAFEEVSRSLPSDAEPIPFSSLPHLVLEMIVEYMGCGDVDRPETYADSLLVMTEVMPVCTGMILRWFRARFIHTRSIARLRMRMAVTFPFSFVAPAELIKTRLCRVCPKGTCGAIWMVLHYIDCHPREWSSLGQSLDHNRMPLQLLF